MHRQSARGPSVNRQSPTNLMESGGEYECRLERERERERKEDLPRTAHSQMQMHMLPSISILSFSAWTDGRTDGIVQSVDN